MAELDSNPKSIQSLYAWYAEGKLWVNRRYQRKLVWTLDEKQRLIESVLNRYPIPAILLAERDDGSYEVIDGLQRLHTLMSFIETSFPTADGRRFNVSEFPTANTRAAEGAFSLESDDGVSPLSPKEVGQYLDYSMAISTMRGATNDQIDDVFGRINTYGHRLSDQERRQAGVQNNFSQLVRNLSSALRGDVSTDVLKLSDTPVISIDLPMMRHGYGVLASEIFWVNHGVLRATDLRDSMDEQCVADIAASIVGGAIIARSKDALDEIYREGSDEGRRIEGALLSYGSEKFEAEFKHVIGRLREICESGSSPIKLRSLLFSKQTTNPFPAVFAVLAIALHELLVTDHMQISSLGDARQSLENLDRRIETSRGSTSPDERRQNVNTIKGLLRPHLVTSTGPSLYDNQSIVDIDDAIRRTEIEAPHYELKQGVLRLDGKNTLDEEMIPKVIRTICGIANNGPERSGAIFLGVADKEADAKRIADIYKISPRKVGRRFVVGVRREATALGESMEDYFVRIRLAIEKSELSAPLKAGVLASMSSNEYFDLGLLVINVPAQREVSSLGSQVFARTGDKTVEVTGPGIVDVARRFS